MAIGAVILAIVITTLVMVVLYLIDETQRSKEENDRVWRENTDLRRRIAKYEANEQRSREKAAYDKGLYDGRATDTYYRQCLKRFTSREQTNIILDGDGGKQQ